MDRRTFLRRGGVLVGGATIGAGCTGTQSGNSPATGSSSGYPSVSTGDENCEATPARGAPSTDWATFQHDTANTGFASEAAGPTAGEQRWRFETNDRISDPPAVVDGTVYASSWDDHVYALDATSGCERWLFDTGETVSAAPAVADGTVFVGNLDGSIWAIDAAAGSEQWEYSPESEAVVFSSPTVADGTVYTGIVHQDIEEDVVSSYPHLYALDVADGSVHWRQSNVGEVSKAPALVDETLYVGHGGTLSAFDASNGRERWSRRFEGSSRRSPHVTAPTVRDGVVYVGTNQGVVALDAQGSELWRFTGVTSVFRPPAVTDDSLFAANLAGRLVAVDLEGSERWRVDLGDRIVTSPAVAGATVYQSVRNETTKEDRADDDSILYALATDDGSEQWQFAVTAAGFSSPAIAGETVYLGSRIHDNSVYALGDES